MVERYLFVKLQDGEVARREAIAAHVRAALIGAGAGAARVGIPADDSAGRWDLSIAIPAADLAAWQRLAAEPAVAALLGDWLPARAAVVKAWTFALAG